MTTIIHLWKKKSLSHRTKGVRKGNAYSRMMQLLLFYFLSTLYLMFDYLWVCLWLLANHHIHAKSNGYTVGFISLVFFFLQHLTHWPWLLCPHILLSWLSFILSDWSVSSSTVNPCYSACSLCRSRQKSLTTKTSTLHSHPRYVGLSVLEGLPSRLSLSRSEQPWFLRFVRDVKQNQDDSFQINFLIYQRPSFSKK